MASDTFNWEKKGVLNPLLLNAPITALNKDWVYKDNLLISSDDPNLYLINPTENTIQTIPMIYCYTKGRKIYNEKH